MGAIKGMTANILKHHFLFRLGLSLLTLPLPTILV